MPRKAKKSAPEEFYVEKILEHKWSYEKGKRKEKWFFVKWFGYEDNENSWIPASNFGDGDMVQRYEAKLAAEKRLKRESSVSTSATRPSVDDSDHQKQKETERDTPCCSKSKAAKQMGTKLARYSTLCADDNDQQPSEKKKERGISYSSSRKSTDTKQLGTKSARRSTPHTNNSDTFTAALPDTPNTTNQPKKIARIESDDESEGQMNANTAPSVATEEDTSTSSGTSPKKRVIIEDESGDDEEKLPSPPPSTSTDKKRVVIGESENVDAAVPPDPHSTATTEAEPAVHTPERATVEGGNDTGPTGEEMEEEGRDAEGETERATIEGDNERGPTEEEMEEGEGDAEGDEQDKDSLDRLFGTPSTKADEQDKGSLDRLFGTPSTKADEQEEEGEAQDKNYLDQLFGTPSKESHHEEAEEMDENDIDGDIDMSSSEAEPEAMPVPIVNDTSSPTNNISEVENSEEHLELEPVDDPNEEFDETDFWCKVPLCDEEDGFSRGWEVDRLLDCLCEEEEETDEEPKRTVFYVIIKFKGYRDAQQIRLSRVEEEMGDSRVLTDFLKEELSKRIQMDEEEIVAEFNKSSNN